MSEERYTGHIRLENLFCRASEFEQVAVPSGAMSEVERPEPPDEFQMGISLTARERGEHRADVQLSVMIEPDEENDQPYAVHVAYVGQFSFGDLPESLSREGFVGRNAAAIMFPFVREAIGNLTSRGAYGPLWLPPINVVAMLEQSRQEVGSDETGSAGEETDRVASGPESQAENGA